MDIKERKVMEKLEAIKKALVSVTNENEKILQDLSNSMAKIKIFEKENEKLKQELADCIASNELLDKENDRLRQELGNEVSDNFNQYIDSVYADKQFEELKQENDRLIQSETEAKEIIAELESKLAEYEKFGLNKDLENLKRLK